MTNDELNLPDKSLKAKRTSRARERAELDRSVSIDVECSGDWMPVEDLREAALSAVNAGSDVTLNLDRVNHLDASALQILLALDAEQKKRGRNLQLTNASSHLQQWFEYAGAAHFFMTGQKHNE